MPEDDLGRGFQIRVTQEITLNGLEARCLKLLGHLEARCGRRTSSPWQFGHCCPIAMVHAGQKVHS